MSDVTLSTVDAIMKELYIGQKPMDTALQNKPALKYLNKKDNFVGDVYPLPVTIAHGAGRSANFVTAQSAASGGVHYKWLLTRVTDYAVLTINAETMKASKNNLGAFVEARKWEVDGMLDEMGRSAAIALYGAGYGVLGARGSVSGEVITMANAGEARKFYKGMKLGVLEADYSAFRTITGSAVVESVDADANTVTLEAGGVAAIGTFTDGDLLIQLGDAGLTGTPAKNKITGFAGWLPLTAPVASESFFGVDRSVDPTRLAGHRLDNATGSIEENILTLAERISGDGGRPDTCFMSHENFSTLVKSMHSKVEYQGAGGTEDYGFSGVKMHSSAGVINVVPDPFAPSNRGYLIQKDVWNLHHLEGFPHIVQDDGLMALRQSAADGVEIRIRYWAQLACRAPLFNGVFSI